MLVINVYVHGAGWVNVRCEMIIMNACRVNLMCQVLIYQINYIVHDNFFSISNISLGANVFML